MGLVGFSAKYASRVIASSVAVLGIVAFAPANARPAGQNAEVAYFDPTAMTPQARIAANAAGRGDINRFERQVETYPASRSDNTYIDRQSLVGRPSSNAAPTLGLDQRNFVKIGAPYRSNGVWYVPANETNYDEVGLVSWYGQEFQGRRTSNGEVYDMDQITAAHPTLPLPSIVEVTNLQTGKTLRVRINDRGPFQKGRLIDLSRRAAQELGVYGQGNAKVRVRYAGPASPVTAAGGVTPTTYVRADAASTSGQGGIQPAVYSQPIVTRQLPMVNRAEPAKPATVAAGTKARPGRYLQVGAFSSAENAARLKGKLDKSTPVRVLAPSDTGANMYRVVMGPLSDEAALGLARAYAAKAGIASPRVVALD